eukprot:XP_015583124.1 uncharacterized protein LOC8281238 isoform X1 [Ricinus communis]
MSSLQRNASELKLSAPPPSPIPTGKGSRSAANEILCEYLEKTLNIPDLSLPEPHIPLLHDDIDTPPNIPEQIDYQSLELGDYETIDRLLRSAREFGAFMIIDHGIFYHDDSLRSLVLESDRVFRDLEQADTGVLGNFGNENTEQIAWVRSGNKRMKCTRDHFVTERYRNFSEKMETIATKLDAIAELLGQIFVENIARMHFGKRIQGKESVLSLYRYNNNYKLVRKPFLPNEKNCKRCDHTLCLHLPARRSRFFVQSASGPLSFDAGPDTIVVIVGQRFEEWSMGDFKCACGELICEPHLQGNQVSFSVELKCLSLDLDPSSNKGCKTISIRDQILIMLVIVFLYKIVMFLFS